MNTAQRLRALAKRTALDGIGEELLAIADGLDGATQALATTEPSPASPADMQVYDKIAAGYFTERKGERAKSVVIQCTMCADFDPDAACHFCSLLSERDVNEWRNAVAVAEPVPNTGMVPVKARTILAVDRLVANAVAAQAQPANTYQQVPEGVQWFTVAEHGLPDVGEEVIGGLWCTDPWLKPECATRFLWGLCRVVADDHRDFPQGKRWQTFGPAHSQITHWARLNLPALDAARKVD